MLPFTRALPQGQRLERRSAKGKHHRPGCLGIRRAGIPCQGSRPARRQSPLMAKGQMPNSIGGEQFRCTETIGQTCRLGSG
ncbi:hypothetical protein BIWAKO_03653 [Bosea sp. BIWAKO-01]|nr:hypothetical protein BIWAKO_03653 [Bosea sp. BIWAKO-01]